MGVIGATTLGAVVAKRWAAVPKGDAKGRRRALLGLTKVWALRLLCTLFALLGIAEGQPLRSLGNLYTLLRNTLLELSEVRLPRGGGEPELKIG